MFPRSTRWDSSWHLISFMFRSAVQSKVISNQLKPFRALLMTAVVPCFCKKDGERKGNVLTYKQLGEILKKLLFLLPPVPSLLTSQGSSIHLILISSCCPSLHRPNCLPSPVPTVSSTQLSGSVLDRDWQSWWVSRIQIKQLWSRKKEVGRLISCAP